MDSVPVVLAACLVDLRPGGLGGLFIIYGVGAVGEPDAGSVRGLRGFVYWLPAVAMPILATRQERQVRRLEG